MIFLVAIMVVLIVLTKMIQQRFLPSSSAPPLSQPPITVTATPLKEIVGQITTQPPTLGKVVLSIADNGKTIIVGLQQRITLLLAGNATTGFSWRVTNHDGDTVHITSPGKKFIYQSSPQRHNFVGGGGFFHLDMMSGLTQGKTTFYFIYDRSFDERLGYDYSITLDVHRNH